ncbi:MAG: response regulator [Pseudomonadota bacterium]
MEIKPKLSLLLGSLLSFMVVSAVAGIVSTAVMIRNAHHITEIDMWMNSVQDVRVATQRLLMPAHDYLIHGRPQEKTAFDPLLEATDSKVTKLFEYAKRHEDRIGYLTDIKRLTDVVTPSLEKIATISRKILELPPSDRSDIGGSLMEEMDLVADRLTDFLDREVSNARMHLSGSLIKAREAEKTTRTVLILAVLLFVGTGAAGGVFVVKSISDPIEKLSEGTRKIASGDWSHRVKIDSRDEMSQLADAFNIMTSELESTTVSRKFHEGIVNNISESLMIIDPRRFTIIAGNKTFFKEYGPPEKTIGKTCYEITHNSQSPCKAPEHPCPLNQSLETGLPAEAEHIHFDKSGNRRYIQVSIYPMKDEKGEVYKIIHLERDVTENVKMEERLRQVHKMEAVGVLAGGVAHAFNNLLMGIQGNASLALLDIDSTHPHYERLTTIENLVKRGAVLTSQLLGYARKGKYQVETINLNQLVEETSSTFGRTKKEIKIHCELEPDLSVIDADKGQIEQVLFDLYINAAEAMPNGGDLILKTTNTTYDNIKGTEFKPKQGKYVLITVRDTGPGMDKKTAERIFDPFFTTKGMVTGGGLGLSSAYGIIKGHGGYIDFDSVQGAGATFKIYLPVSAKKIVKSVERVEKVVQKTGAILLVDDEEIILEVGKGLLEAIGYQALIAGDGKEAIEIYKENKGKIDVVILDMVMPEMGGGETYDRLREINSDIKVILASGYSIDGEASDILERGCNTFIQKPFQLKELSECINKVLSNE